jgi:hypothetical protein
MWEPLSGHSGHSWNRHMFLYQTHKHPERQKDRKITYGRIVCDCKPKKKRKRTGQVNSQRRQARLLRRRRDVHGGHHNIQNLDQQHPFHRRRSHDDDGHKNYYMGTPLPRFEYMKMLLSRFPEEIVQKYNLNALAVDGWVYIEIRKGMYGLKQGVLLTNQLLQTRLAPFGYNTARHTPGQWLHKTRPIYLSFVVDDFAVKYVGKQHVDHLRHALLKTYELATDWAGTVYSGMTFKWDYKNRTCDISMPGCVSNVLSKFQHDTPKHPQHTPSRYVTPVYSAKLNMR